MRQYERITANESLKKNRKAIISLGCSFARGQGALESDLLEDFKWDLDEKTNGVVLKDLKQNTAEILRRYPYLESKLGYPDFKRMELRNSFVHYMCREFFNNEWTPINMGQAGRGNRATISGLFFNTDIDWSIADELIVVYCPTGLERFDFVNGQHFNSEAGVYFETMWPYSGVHEPDTSRYHLWKGYEEAIWNTKQGIMEQILNIHNLQMWCEIHDARLVITSAFDLAYSRDYFMSQIMTGKNSNEAELIDKWPWDKMFYPNGAPTIIDMCLAQEGLDQENHGHYWQYFGHGTPQGYVTKCAHPGKKSHELFATLLAKELNL